MSAFLFPRRPLDRHGFRHWPVRSRALHPLSSRGSRARRVIAMVEDPSGSLWMIHVRDTNASLATLRQDGSVRTYGPADGLPDQRLATLYHDRAANLWIGTNGGLCRWSPGTPAACSSAPSRQILSVVGGSSGESSSLIAPGASYGSVTGDSNLS